MLFSAQDSTTGFKFPEQAKFYKVLPHKTDREIDDWLDPHYAIAPHLTSRKNRLFLFLSGSYGDPSNQCLILQTAAQLGYYAINLCYPNSWTVAGLCRNSVDLEAHDKVRWEIIDGIKRSNLIDISRANSIENRLIKLLLYLHQQHPEEGWFDYIDGNFPKWESIVVAGHSQGGGHAAIIAKEHIVDRVILLGAPADYNRILKRPASWLSTPHITPADRYYGFAHLQDPGIKRISIAWRLLGMTAYGSPVNVDSTPLPYHQSHQLVTRANPASRQKYHGCVAVDAHTPKLPDGTPRFKSVWQYLLGDT